MALSDQLRNLSRQARGITEQQQGVGMAQVGMQTQQALAQIPGQPQGKAAAQQLAAGVTGAQQQVVGQAQAQGQAAQLQLAQQGLQQVGQQKQQALAERQALNDGEIAELQRQGQLRQNSASLKQAKALQKDEIDMQNRMLSQGLAYDNKLSFLTNKQRKDLADLGAYTKQQLFDSRLTFKQDELGRQFTNTRQLADYAILSAQSEDELMRTMQDIEQAAEKSMLATQYAQSLIEQKMKTEFAKSEQEKDQALLKELAVMKADLEKKLARQKAKASGTASLLKGALTLTGAAIGVFTPVTPAGGAAIGAGLSDVIIGSQG